MSYQLGTRYAFDIFSKTKEAKKFTDLEKILTKHLKYHANFSLWFLKLMLKDTTVLFDNVFYYKSLDVRNSFSSMLQVALTSILRTEEVILGTNDQDKTVYMKFIKLLVGEGLVKARLNEKKFDEYFQLLAHISNIGPKEATSLIQLGLIGKTIDFIANTKTSLLDESKTYQLMDKRFTNFSEPIHLLSQLIFSVSGKGMEKITLPEEEIKLLFSKKWDFLSLIEHKFKCASKIYCHLSIENPERIKILIPALIKEIYGRRIQKNYSIHIIVLKDLISVKDSFIKRRWELAFAETEIETGKNILEQLGEYKLYHENFRIEILNLIAELLQIKEIVDVIKASHLPKLAWSMDFLTQSSNENFMTNFISLAFSDTKKKKEFILKQFAEILGLQKKKLKMLKLKLKMRIVKVYCQNKVYFW